MSSFAGAVAGLIDFLARFGASIGIEEEEKGASETAAEAASGSFCDDGPLREEEEYCIPTDHRSLNELHRIRASKSRGDVYA